MKVLIALDDSRHSDIAFDSVRSRVWPAETEFVLCSVVESSLLAPAELRPEQTLALQKIEDERADSLEESLNHKVSELNEIFPRCTAAAKVVRGQAAASIIEVACRYQSDLIVMGSHGRSGIQLYALGSVAEAVVQYAPCSIEVIRTTSGLMFNQRLVLICFDGSDNAHLALDWAARSSWADNQEFCVLSVIAPLEDVLPGAKMKQPNAFRRADAELTRAAQRKVAQAAKVLERSIRPEQIKTVVCEGYAADVILQFAQQWPSDLIVLGAHAQPASGCIGTVARRVTVFAKCCVKIVRNKQAQLVCAQLQPGKKTDPVSSTLT